MRVELTDELRDLLGAQLAALRAGAKRHEQLQANLAAALARDPLDGEVASLRKEIAIRGPKSHALEAAELLHQAVAGGAAVPPADAAHALRVVTEGRTKRDPPAGGAFSVILHEDVTAEGTRPVALTFRRG
jgi:hypothetical protein